MKIIDVRKKPLVDFETISEGEAFFTGNHLYVKISQEEAVCITNDFVTDKFSWDTSVEPVELEMIIRSKS